MNNTQIVLVADAINRISDMTGTDDYPRIIEALEGVAFDEQDADEIRRFLSGDTDVHIL